MSLINQTMKHTHDMPNCQNTNINQASETKPNLTPTLSHDTTQLSEQNYKQITREQT